MAIIALVFGSFFGFFGALTGWMVWDLSFFAALGVYMGFSLTLATIGITMIAMRPDLASDDMGYTA